MLDFQQVNVRALKKIKKSYSKNTIQTNLPSWSLRAAKYIAMTGQKQYLACV